jgi:hypothetical protein
MAWSKDYRASLIVVDQTTDEAIYGIQSFAVNMNPAVRKQVATGSRYPTTASLDSLSPVISFTTAHLKQAMDQLGLGGKCIATPITGLDFYVQLQSCEGPAAGSVHRKYRVPLGIIVPRTFQVDHRGDATMSYDVLATYDGTNAPVTITDNVALPAPTLPANVTKDDRYTMDKMVFKAIPSVEGKRSISIDFGTQTSSEGADSLPYDTVQAITSVNPVLTVSGVDIQWAETLFTVLGTSVVNASPIDVYLKKRNIANATAQHIRLRIQGLANFDQLVSATPDSPGTTSFRVDCLEEGANAPIVVNTAIAIP